MHKKNKGFFTIEAIVAILVFIIGILGILKIQSTSIKNVTDSDYRITASYLANSMLNQIWVDKSNMDTYLTSSGTEYTRWLAEVQQKLPGSTATRPTIIKTDTPNGPLVTITLYWQMPDAEVVSKYVTQSTLF